MYSFHRKVAGVVAQVVAHQTTDREVPGLIPAAAGSWAFSLSSLSSLSYVSIIGASLIRSLVEVQHYWFSTFQENEKKLSSAF